MKIQLMNGLTKTWIKLKNNPMDGPTYIIPVLKRMTPNTMRISQNPII